MQHNPAPNPTWNPSGGTSPDIAPPMPSKPSDLCVEMWKQHHQITLSPCQKTQNICSFGCRKGDWAKVNLALQFSFLGGNQLPNSPLQGGFGAFVVVPNSEDEVPLGTMAPMYRESRASDVLAWGRAIKSGPEQEFGLLVIK